MTTESATQVNQTSKVPLLKDMQVSVYGKVLRVRRYDNHTYTAIVTPAPDLYSKPQIVEIRSKARFAEVEEETRCTARLGGYEGRPYMTPDKEMGERRQVVPVNLFLDLVE